VILGKHDEITEVFVNLLENAIKYGFDGSDITLAITMVAPRHVRIEVTNFGEGIEERHLPRLTERFYRVDKVPITPDWRYGSWACHCETYRQPASR
jgi:two-component system phosphate regulon sensor histidine kinase PhoR